MHKVILECTEEQIREDYFDYNLAEAGFLEDAAFWTRLTNKAKNTSIEKIITNKGFLRSYTPNILVLKEPFEVVIQVVPAAKKKAKKSKK